MTGAVLDRSRRPHVMRQRRESTKRSREMHTYMVLEDASGAIRVDRYEDGTVTVECDYVSDGDGEAVRTEKLRRGVSVGTLLDALNSEPSLLCKVNPCRKCGLNVSILRAVHAGGDHYHRGCLDCAVCGEGRTKAKGEVSFCVEGVTLHPSCAQCTACTDPITSGPILLQGRSILHAKCIPKCPACQRSVSATTGVAAGRDGEFFHSACVQCKVCRKPTTDVPASEVVKGARPGEVVHVACCTKCTECKGCLLPGVPCWETAVGAFHDDCFRCAECRVVLSEDHRLARGFPHCVPCYRNVLSTTLTPTKNTIEDDDE